MTADGSWQAEKARPAGSEALIEVMPGGTGPQSNAGFYTENDSCTQEDKCV